MIIYYIIFAVLVILFITTFHYKIKEYRHLPLKEHPFKFLYGISFYILELPKHFKTNNKLSTRDIKLAQKLEKLYIGLNPEKLVRLYKAKLISFSVFILFIISIAGIVFFSNSNSSDEYINTIERPTGSESSTYELTAIVNGETTNISLEITPQTLTFEEVLAYFEDNREGIEQALISDNTSLYEIKKDLDLINSFNSISISWEIENTDYIDYSGHIIQENIPDNGVMTNLYATLSYCKHTSTIIIPIFIEKTFESLSFEEQLINEIENNNNPYESSIVLPTSVNGSSVYFTTKNSNYALPFFYLG